MKVDRHSDTVEELYKYLMDELQGITTSLNGKLSHYIISNSQGNKHKRIQIDYDFNT